MAPLSLDDTRLAAGNRTHRELFMAWHAQFTDYKYVQRYMQSLGDFIRDRDSASGKSQDHNIPATDVGSQVFG